MSQKSDFPAAAVGFFGGVILVAAILFGISRWTSAQFASHEPAPAGATTH
jgi:hypothetical protein